MRLSELLELFERNHRRCHLFGAEAAGVVAGLDLEGRLYAILDGEVLNRVNPAAFIGQSSRDGYLNPGGDGLWPAPEGTVFGYEYATGKWRVPPAITGARYRVVDATTIEAEIDLVNSRQLGVPTIFRRGVEVSAAQGKLVVDVNESIEYIGARTLKRSECLLAPWTLCQFESGPGSEVVFPDAGSESVRDLYGPSGDRRKTSGGLVHALTDGSGPRYQIALDERVEWLEYRDPTRRLTVRRSTVPLPVGDAYIDIVDAPPTELPSDKGVRLSVYSDPSSFMEIEAIGGCPAELAPGAVMAAQVRTEYSVAIRPERVTLCG